VPLTRKLQRLLDELAAIDDPQEQLAAVVDRARRHPPLPPSERTDAHRVRGCVSVVWLVGAMRAGHCHFRSDAESPVVRGLLALLCEFFNGATPAQVLAFDSNPLDAAGLTRNLSPTRRHGLASAHAAIREFARSHAAPLASAS
jgi:cysteine desulfuration protein SufE